MKKRTLSLLAVVLVLSMLLGILPTFGTARAEEPAGGDTQTAAGQKGFRSEQFLRENSYQYADSDIVRAIVVLKNVPVADVMPYGSAPRGEATQAETTQAVKIAREHTTVFNSMSAKRIDYDLAYEFDTLLNGFSCDVEYGELDEIASIPGVDAVYIANTYSVPQEPNMSASNELTGNAAMISNYSGGEGTVIAVLDTGINYNHEAFQPNDKYTYGPLTEADLAKTVAPGRYISEKLPFTYDYAERDSDAAESPVGEGHGSHVAGIAAGYAATPEGEVTFSGAAPGAQIVFMKVFGDDRPTTSSDIYFAALEDAFRLGVDVINMSLGSDSGFTHDSSLESTVFGNIYKRLNAAGIVLCIAAGNSGSMLDFGAYGDITSTKGYIGPDYTDYGLVSNPSTYEGTVSVASMENSKYPVYQITVGEAGFEYTDTSEADDENNWLKKFGGRETDYVVVTDSEGGISLGEPEDYELEGNEVEGKIAVVQRGTIDFETKMNNAKEAGAVGCIVVNNEPGIIRMSITEFTIPAIAVGVEAREVFLGATAGQVTTPEDMVLVDSPDAGRMSTFSNWGTTPDLTIKPTITSVGGRVNSVDASTDDGYLLMDGTSMASPNMAGTFANVLAWLRDNGVTKKEDAAETAEALLESTAGLAFDENGYLYSVRKQGTGLGMADKAIAAYEKAYITDPIKELEDNDKGTFTFSVALKNNSEEQLTYTPEAVVMTDKIVGGENTLTSDYLYNDFAGEDGIYDAGLVTVTVGGAALGKDSAASVTVGANQTAEVTVTVELTPAGLAYLEEQGFVNGAFVEGYVQFTADGATPVHATFLGYQGDWTKAPVFETQDFRDYQKIVYDVLEELKEEYAEELEEGGLEVLQQLEGIAAQMALTQLDVVTSYNSAAIIDSYMRGVEAGSNLLGITEFNEKHINLSTSETDAAYVYYDQLYLAPYQLRNLEEVSVTVADKEGNVYFEDADYYIPKSVFDTDAWYVYNVFQWDGNDMNGDPVPNGTELTVSFSGKLPYKDTVLEDIWSFDLTIDSKAPVIESAEYDADTSTLTLTVSDNQYLAGVALIDDYGEIIDQFTFSDDEPGQSHTVEFTDNSGFGLWELMGYQSFTVAALDYATNQTEALVPLIDSDLLGTSATIQLETPSGTKRVATTVGAQFTFPSCKDSVDKSFEFIGWVDSECDKVAYRDLYTLGSINLEGDSVMVTGDATYYALYKEGEYVTYEHPRYTYFQSPDYSGDWAIAGWPLVYDEDYRLSDFDPDDLYVLTPGTLGSQLAEYDPDSVVNIDDTLCFESGEDGLSYTFTKLSDGTYSIKNAVSGKYLAYVDGEIAEADDTSEPSSHWFVETSLQYYGVYMWPASDPGMYLLFDDENCQFMMTDEVEILDVPGVGEVKYANYMTLLYKRAEGGIDDYTSTYTTRISTQRPSTPSIPIPVDPVETPETPTPEDPAGRFVDVEKGKWYYDAVNYVVEKGLMDGTSDTTFQPGAVTTRAMIVTILYRLEGEPAVAKNIPYADVPAGKWYSDAIVWAAANGIVNGYSDTEFGPNDPVTRQQMAAILYRYAAYKKYDTSALADLSVFTDAGRVGAWATDAVRWSVATGLIKGTSDVTLSPADNSTRAQIATILMRFCEDIVK